MIDAQKLGVGGIVRVIAGIDSERKLIRLTGTIREIKNKTGVFLCRVEEARTMGTYWIETCVSICGPIYGWVEPFEERKESFLSQSEIVIILENARMACVSFDNDRFAAEQQRIFEHIPRYEKEVPPDKGGPFQRMILIRDIMAEYVEAKDGSRPIAWFAKAIHDYLGI